jgi:hypothetical protein
VKKLILSIVLIIQTFICFSQPDTNTIKINEQTAKLIIKELIEKDSTEKILGKYEDKILVQQEIIGLKDSVIFMMDSINTNYLKVITNNKAQMAQYKEINEIAFNQLEQQKKNMFWYRLSAFFNVVSTFVILIIK